MRNLGYTINKNKVPKNLINVGDNSHNTNENDHSLFYFYFLGNKHTHAADNAREQTFFFFLITINSHVV